MEIKDVILLFPQIAGIIPDSAERDLVFSYDPGECRLIRTIRSCLENGIVLPGIKRNPSGAGVSNGDMMAIPIKKSYFFAVRKSDWLLIPGHLEKTYERIYLPLPFA